jgi:hypothetical protein
MVCTNPSIFALLSIDRPSVLVDKPIVENSAHARELGQLAKSKKLVLYGFQNRRWDSDFQALQRLLALPKSSPTSLGDIFEFESRSVFLLIEDMSLYLIDDPVSIVIVLI